MSGQLISASKYRKLPQFSLGLDDLVVDNFAGGGGASTGIEAAIGRAVDIAINHDPIALGMHEVNHPQTLHLCESVWDVDPVKICQGRPVALAWFSPDCRHFSKAKGGKPVSPRVRGLAWVAKRWAATVRPRVVILENVEEFSTWGPLIRYDDGTFRPCPKRKGRTFQQFIREFRRLGYEVDYRELRACDYGAPTIRKRLFLIARCDGQPIVWPEPTHGPGLKTYRAAADIIDWSLPCPSIFERKRPLADATCRRIAEGLRRFVIENEAPFIAPVSQTGSNHSQLVHAFLAKHYTGVIGSDLRQPIGTITSVDHHSLVTSHMVKLRGDNIGHDVREPVHTISAGGTHHGEVRAFLVKYYSEGGQWQSLRDPVHTIPTKDRLGLVMVRGEPYRVVDIGMRMLQPPELYAANSFPSDYIHDRLADGTRITKTNQVKMCGNSVPPALSEALVRANVTPLVPGRRAAA